MKRLYELIVQRWILLVIMIIPATLTAQRPQAPSSDGPGLKPVSATYAITNVNIIQAPGRKIDMGTVVMKDGLIVSVGKNVSIPADAIIIKADSMYVYAGFIDGLSRTGVTKPKEDQNQERPKDPGNPTPEQAGITPQLDVRPFLNPADKSVEELRNTGFGVSHVIPYGGMIPGTGSIVLLGGESASDMVLANGTALGSELAPARRMYPGTVMGVMAKYRELYRQASQSRAYEGMYASNRAGLQRPNTDPVQQAFYPVIDKKIPVLFKVERVIDVQRVLTLQRDLGFNLMLAEVKEGWDIIPKIKASNAKVFLSLELPEEKKEEKKDDKKDDKKGEKKEDEAKKPEKPKTAADLEKEALEKRKEEFLVKYVSQAAAFQKAGVKFGFSAMNVKPKDIQPNLIRMIKAGLPEDAALAALTTVPAELLGMSDRLGSIDNGKIANLVISDKPYFDEKAKVRYVFVDGAMHKLDVKETKKGDPNAKVDAAGTWSYTTETPQGSGNGKLKLTKDGSGLSGTMTNSFSGQETEISNASLDGNSLTFSFTIDAGGNSMTIEMAVTITGNEFEGTMSVGQYGSFPIKGTKDPNR